MRYILIIVLLLAFNVAEAQECNLTVRGRVVDKSDRTPLSFATIVVKEDRTKGAIADIHGNFTIGDLCPGEYHLEIAFVGYETGQEFVVLNDNLQVEFQLG